MASTDFDAVAGSLNNNFYKFPDTPSQVTAYKIGRVVIANFLALSISTDGVTLQSLNLPNAIDDFHAIVATAGYSDSRYLSIDNGTKLVLRTVKIDAVVSGSTYGTLIYICE